MSERLVYLDSSVLVKLVVREPETAAVIRLLADWPQRVSSSLARVEVLRAVRRAGARPTALDRAERVLARVNLIRVDDAVIDQAAGLLPIGLRSLDALHLASALSLGSLVGAFATYDTQLARVAVDAGLTVLAPTSA